MRVPPLAGMIAGMVGAAVGVGLLLIWLAGKRLEYTWRISWLAAAFAVICAASLAAGGRLSGWISGGIFTLIQGVVRLILAL